MTTFFLDSIDELKITQKSLEQALKPLGRACAGNVDRARVVITTGGPAYTQVYDPP
jgi:hypothetical protein